MAAAACWVVMEGHVEEDRRCWSEGTKRWRNQHPCTFWKEWIGAECLVEGMVDGVAMEEALCAYSKQEEFDWLKFETRQVGGICLADKDELSLYKEDTAGVVWGFGEKKNAMIWTREDQHLELRALVCKEIGCPYKGHDYWAVVYTVELDKAMTKRLETYNMVWKMRRRGSSVVFSVVWIGFVQIVKRLMMAEKLQCKRATCVH